ncbi:MAG: DUF4149 domain-containing protein [Candidatus Methylomirabilales bacterium]
MRRVLLILLAAGVGIWLGAMLFLTFALAPTAFAILESRQQAGDLVAATLNILYLSGYIVGPLLVFLSLVTGPLSRRLLWVLRTTLLALITVSTIISREVVGAKLLNLRRSMGVLIEQVPPDDPLRLLFHQWHQFSVLLMLFSIAAAAAVLLLIFFEGFGEARS